MTKDEIVEKFKGNFYQYLIYVEEDVYCVDGDFSSDGIYACDDEGNIYKSPFDLYDTYIEYYEDDFESEEVKEYFKGFKEFPEYEAWDLIEEYFNKHFDYVSFSHYRKEHRLKNICFTKETAIDLCKKYGNNSYYTSDRIKNDDIFYLKQFFNEMLES